MNSISGVMMPCAGVPELRDGMAGAGAERAAALAGEAGEFHEAVALRLAGVLGVFAGEVAVVLWLHSRPS